MIESSIEQHSFAYLYIYIYIYIYHGIYLTLTLTQNKGRQSLIPDMVHKALILLEEVVKMAPPSSAAMTQVLIIIRYVPRLAVGMAYERYTCFMIYILLSICT